MQVRDVDEDFRTLLQRMAYPLSSLLSKDEKLYALTHPDETQRVIERAIRQQKKVAQG